MNHIYRVVWNATLGTWTVVSELARGHRPRLGKLSAALIMGLAVQGQGMATDYTAPVVADNGSEVSLDGDTVTVSGPMDLFALGAYHAGSRLDAHDVTVLTSGDGLMGAYVGFGGQMTLTGGSVTTQGDVAYGAMAMSTDARFTATDTSILTGGINAHGVLALDGASVGLTGGSVTTTGEAAAAVMAGDGTVTLDGTSVTTQGTNSLGLYAFDAGNLNASHVTLTTAGNYAYGLAAEAGGWLSFTDGSITTQGAFGYGVAAQGAGTHISIANTAISAASSGVAAAEGGTVTLDRVQLDTQGGYAEGIWVQGVGTQVTVTNTTISTAGAHSFGVSSEGGTVSLDNTQVDTRGDVAYGVLAYNTGTQVLAADTTIETQGESSDGIRVIGGASVEWTGGSVTTTGYNSAAVAVGAGVGVGGNGTVTLDGTYLGTQGDGAFGVWSSTGTVAATNTTISTMGAGSFGVVAYDDAAITLTGGSISTAGDGSAALVTTNGASVTATNVQIETLGQDDVNQGLSAYGVDAEWGGVVSLGGSTAVSTVGDLAVALRASGPGSQLTSSGQLGVTTAGEHAYGAIALNGGVVALGQGATIDTLGDRAHGLVSLGAGSQVDATGVQVTTHGANADGVALGNASMSLTNSTIQGQRNGLSLSTDGSASTANSVLVSAGTLRSVTGYAIYAEAGSNTVNLAQGAQVSGGNGVLLGVATAGTSVDLTATDHVALDGDLIAVNGSTANVSLAQASVLTGAAYNVGGIDVDATSQWNLTANSDVQQLALGGIVAFAAPASSYKTLTVHGDWIGGGGTVVLNTQLNEGGPLANQFTDRVLVEGNASGTTYLAVTGSGTGALTDTNRNGVLEPNEGISLAQVAGQAGASAFRLAGGYVAVGPWRYELHDYQPGSADAGQRVVAGSGNGYWDYRLQNAYVADPNPANPTNPTNPTNPVGPTGPTGTQRPAVVPQVPSYLAASTAMLAYGLRSLGTLHDRLGELHNDAASTDRQAAEFYARVFGGDYRYGSNRSFAQYGYDFDQNDRAVQIGGTWLKAMGDSSTWRLGAYGVTGDSRITPRAADGSSRMRMTGNSLGLTGTYEQANGLYLDGVVARNFYRTSVDTAERGRDMAEFRTRGWSYSLEAGIPFVFGNGLRLEPQAQVVYQSLHTASFTDRDGLTVSPATSHAWTGRLGTYLSKTFTTEAGGRWTPWARLNYVASGDSGDDVNVRSDAWSVNDTLVSGKWGRVVQLGAGITGAWSDAWSIYGGADYQAKVGDVGERGWSANLGLRWRF